MVVPLPYVELILVLFVATFRSSGVVAKSATLGLDVAQFFSPVVESIAGASSMAERIFVFDKTIMDYRRFFLVDFGQIGGKKVFGLVSEIPDIALWPYRNITESLCLTQSSVYFGIENSGIASSHNQDVSKNRNIVGGSLSLVRYLVWYSIHAVLGSIDTPWLNGYISSKLGFGTSPVLFQVGKQRDQSTTSQKRLKYDTPKPPIAKYRYGLLCSKNAVLALFGIAGLGLGYYSLRRSVNARNISKSIFWGISWIGLTAIGGYCAVMALVGSI